MRRFTILLLTIACLTSTTFALDLATDVHFVNLSMWDHLSTKNGQLFEDVYEDVDLTVTANGDFQLPSYVINKTMLISPNEVVGQQTFEFSFSKPVPLVIQHQTTDDAEIARIQSTSIMEYVHQWGSPALVTAITGGYEIQGTGRRIEPNGAATGYIHTGPVSSITLTHESLAPFKFEAFRVGIVTVNTPEPASGSLLLFCAIGLFHKFRRR